MSSVIDDSRLKLERAHGVPLNLTWTIQIEDFVSVSSLEWKYSCLLKTKKVNSTRQLPVNHSSVKNVK